MGLKALIKRIEENKLNERDYEHPLSRGILEELAQGENHALMKSLFNDIRNLNDEIISDYVLLARCYKFHMMENYTGCRRIKNRDDYELLKKAAVMEYEKNKSAKHD